MKSQMKALMLILSFSALCACSPVNTQFSCNATAGDHCLSIEEVNAMTESHEEHNGNWRERVRSAPMKAERASPKDSRLANNTQTIWVAPWTDAHGVRHQDGTLYAEAITPQKRG